jgi:hypothetical protein
MSSIRDYYSTRMSAFNNYRYRRVSRFATYMGERQWEAATRYHAICRYTMRHL